MKKLNQTLATSALALAAGFAAFLPAAAQEQTAPMQPQSPFHTTQMQPASPQIWDPGRVEAGMQQLGYDNISDVLQEGEQWLANARRDGDDYALTFDPVTGDVRDEAGASVGNLNQMAQNEAAGTTPTGSSATSSGSASASGMAAGRSGADMNASQERVRSALETAGLTNVRILNTAYLVQAQTPQGETVTMIVDTARLAAAAAGAAEGAGGNSSGASSTNTGGSTGQMGNAGSGTGNAGTSSPASDGVPSGASSN